MNQLRRQTDLLGTTCKILLPRLSMSQQGMTCTTRRQPEQTFQRHKSHKTFRRDCKFPQYKRNNRQLQDLKSDRSCKDRKRSLRSWRLCPRGKQSKKLSLK